MTRDKRQDASGRVVDFANGLRTTLYNTQHFYIHRRQGRNLSLFPLCTSPHEERFPSKCSSSNNLCWPSIYLATLLFIAKGQKFASGEGGHKATQQQLYRRPVHDRDPLETYTARVSRVSIGWGDLRVISVGVDRWRERRNIPRQTFPDCLFIQTSTTPANTGIDTDRS